MTRQYDFYIVNLDPTEGAEMKKTRPCIILSPDEMNQHMQTVQIAPLTSNKRGYPWRVPIVFRRKKGMVALDQIRTVGKTRLIRRAGEAPSLAVENIKSVLHEMLVL